jgi:hypothetical protein
VIRLLLLLSLVLTGCVSRSATETGLSAGEIRYVSLDLTRVLVFSGRTARSGGIEAFAAPASSSLLSGASPMQEFRTRDGVQCVSIGPPGYAIQFAVRRPLRANDRYTCLGSSFEVTHCVNDCRAAIIRVERSRAPDIGPFRSQMYVDSRRGLLVYSDTGDLSESVPLGASLLRDPVGILADPSYPSCNWF